VLFFDLDKVTWWLIAEELTARRCGINPGGEVGKPAWGAGNEQALALVIVVDSLLNLLYNLHYGSEKNSNPCSPSFHRFGHVRILL